MIIFVLEITDPRSLVKYRGFKILNCRYRFCNLSTLNSILEHEEFYKGNVAVAEVVYAQDIDPNRLFLPSLHEIRSWSDLT